METKITTQQLLQMYGQKQIELELANARAEDLTRAIEEHMKQEHPAATKEQEEPND